MRLRAAGSSSGSSGTAAQQQPAALARCTHLAPQASSPLSLSQHCHLSLALITHHTRTPAHPLSLLLDHFPKWVMEVLAARVGGKTHFLVSCSLPLRRQAREKPEMTALCMDWVRVGSGEEELGASLHHLLPLRVPGHIWIF